MNTQKLVSGLAKTFGLDPNEASALMIGAGGKAAWTADGVRDKMVSRRDEEKLSRAMRDGIETLLPKLPNLPLATMQAWVDGVFYCDQEMTGHLFVDSERSILINLLSA